ncbi:1-phosphofructokinase family hexose kinase [Thermoproteota archaeon]
MILTITLNVALDHLIYVPHLVPNSINRIERSTIIPGGKGINIAASLAVLEDEVIATGFIGGKDSIFIEQVLQKLGVTTNFIYIDDEIRTDTYIVEQKSNTNTLIIEAGVYIKSSYVKNFLENYKRVLNNVHTVIIAGSVPPGIYPDFVAELADIAQFHDKTVVINCREDILNIVCPHKHFNIVKPDVRDTAHFMGLSTKNHQHRLKMGKAVLDQGADIFALHIEEFHYFIYTRDQVLEVFSKKKDMTPVSLVGIEDSFLAGFSKCITRKMPLEEAAKYGLATAIATGLSLNNYPDSYQEVKKHMKQLEIRTIK